MIRKRLCFIFDSRKNLLTGKRGKSATSVQGLFRNFDDFFFFRSSPCSLRMDTYRKLVCRFSLFLRLYRLYLCASFGSKKLFRLDLSSFFFQTHDNVWCYSCSDSNDGPTWNHACPSPHAPDDRHAGPGTRKNKLESVI